MTLNEILTYINTVLNKDNSGNALTPKEYNVLLEASIFDFVKAKVLEYRSFVTQGGKDDVLFTSSLIDALQARNTPTLSSGSFTVPADMLFLNSMYGTYNSNRKYVEVVSPEEFARRQSNMLSKPIAYYPVAVLVSSTCYFYPSNMTAIALDYIKKPTIPVFDYYIDADYQIQYLAASGSHALGTDEVGSAGQTSGTVTSLTVELDIPEDLHFQFASYLLDKVGVRDRDTLLYQAAQNEKNKP